MSTFVVPSNPLGTFATTLIKMVIWLYLKNKIQKNDEIRRYQIGRYISIHEAVWRIISFPIHERDPTVQHLAVHLENGQRVYFAKENIFQRALGPPKTTLTEFFTLGQKSDVSANSLKHYYIPNVPQYFIWKKIRKKWETRKKGRPHPSIPGIHKANELGRLYTVHPKQRGFILFFFLPLLSLVVNIPGPSSLEFLRAVNGRMFNTRCMSRVAITGRRQALGFDTC